MTKWSWKNSWSTVCCLPPALEHQPWFFSMSNKAATQHYLLVDTTPENLPYPTDATDRPMLLDSLTNFPPACGEICLCVLDQMVAKSTSCSRLTVTIHSLSNPRRGRGAGVQRRLFWLGQRQGNHTTLRCSVQMTTTRSSSAIFCCDYGWVLYYYLSFQTPVALCICVWTAHNLQQPRETDMIRKWCYTSIAPQPLHGYKNAEVRTTDTDIFMILLCHVHAIKQADCIPRYRVRETSPTNQPLWSRSRPWRRLMCGYCWNVYIQWRRLHQCIQREGERLDPWKSCRRNPGFIKRSCNSVPNSCARSWVRTRNSFPNLRLT